MSRNNNQAGRDVRVRWNGPQSNSDLPQIKRAFSTLFALTNPLVGLVWAGVLFGLTRAKVQRTRRPVLLFVVPLAMFVVLFIGAHPLAGYVRPYRESVQAVSDAASDALRPGAHHSPIDALREL